MSKKIDVNAVLDIADAAITLVRQLHNHDESDDTTIEDNLIQIAETADHVLKQHTGESIDESLIHQEPPID